ncbi:MAG: M28 family peptidase [candidate division Zixibacteria bacterium]
MRNLYWVLLILIFAFSLSHGNDLYRIRLSEHADAEYLNSSETLPIAVLSQGYLIIADKSQAALIESQGIEIFLIESDVVIDKLVFDMRHDEQSEGLDDVVFEEEGIRILRLDLSEKSLPGNEFDFMPVFQIHANFQYFEVVDLNIDKLLLPPGLDDLIDSVSRSNLFSNTRNLQNLGDRVAGSAVGEEAQNWIYNRLSSFGYDSLYLDEFTVYIQGANRDCRNVIAVKPGLVTPEAKIVIGAHFDAVPGSPGADDNGSGTSAVIELARVFKNIETNLTFVFALFDAEEYGLHGSRHYANNAYSNGETIIFMINLDMVGAEDNDEDMVRIYHGDDLKYINILQQLADSLLNFDASKAGTSSRSDHYSFQSLGYDVSFFQEWVFSDVYHTSGDNTNRMDFGYMTDVVKIAMATAYSVDWLASPNRSVSVTYPNGLPLSFAADELSSFEVRVEGIHGGSVVPGTAEFNCSIDGGDYVTVPLTEKSAGLYEVEMEGYPAGTPISYYVNAQEASTGLISGEVESKANAGSYLYFESLVFEDDFSLDEGWTVEGDAVVGQWERGIPSGDGINGDPVEDFDGNGWCYLTGNSSGDSNVDGGKTSLISPVFDLSGGYGEVRYSVWFSNSLDREDLFHVYVSGDEGQTWVKTGTLGPFSDDAAGGWQSRSFIVNKYIDFSSTVRVKFEVSDYGKESMVEAGLDGIKVLLHSSESFEIPEQTFLEWTKKQPFSAILKATGGVGVRRWSEINGSFSLVGLTLNPDGTVEGSPTRTGQLSLLAEAYDEVLNTAQRTLSFMVNEPVALHTFSLPGGMIRESYSQQLDADGGTGELIWIDKYGDLEETGLSLSSTGLVSGVVEDPRLIGFTVYISDITGSDQEWTYEMNFEYIDGDANGDNTVNVGDAVFIINHVFKQGPSPYPYLAADTNCDGDVNVGDAVYLVNHIFKGWPAPGC